MRGSGRWPAWGVVWPLLAFLVPSAVIGFAIVLPRAGYGGVNELSIGHAATLIGACLTYVTGVRAAARKDSKDKPQERA